MNNQIIKDDFIINWKRVFVAPLKMWWIMLICAIIGAIGGFCAGLLMENPMYRSRAVYMVNFSISGDSLNAIASQLTVSSMVMNTCVEIAKQNTYYKKVLEQVNDGMPEDQCLQYDQIVEVLTVSASNKSSVALVYIDAITEDKELSKRIIDGVTDTFADYMNGMFSLGDAKIGFRLSNSPEVADKPEEQTSKKTMALAVGAALAAAAYLILCVVEIVDVKIKDVDDLKNKYNAPVLGTVYNFTEMELQSEEEYKYAN